MCVHIFPHSKWKLSFPVFFPSQKNQLGSSDNSPPIKVNIVTFLYIQYTVLLCAIINTIELVQF